ncbi:GIY-YIG nuclease family protein [Pseudanabaena sp. PCC 6802]|uniref:GIY-YIG nuclease family protein n=1 Tax=Pseudanabaena sp. PCC 6802 TaxID=118173 RepID=UPI00034CDC3C|nr:GIY-YIG nuclease family protein [Pseudanabaena sp. PCC 6802]
MTQLEEYKNRHYVIEDLVDEGDMRIVTTSKKEIREVLKQNRERCFYVYVLIRPDTNEVFYVGKGKVYRIFAHEKEALGKNYVNSYKSNLIRKILSQGFQIVYGIVDFYDVEEDALDRECKLIKKIGRANLGSGTLTNLTDGGDGFIGWMDFEKHSRSGRPLSGQPGNIDIMMERVEGVSEDMVIDYLKLDGWGDSEPRSDLLDELPEEFKWIGHKFYRKLKSGYGAKGYLYEYLYGDLKDTILQKINLVEKFDNLLFRREDEFICILKILLSSNGWISKCKIVDALLKEVNRFKGLQRDDAERITNFFTEQLKQLGKLSQRDDKLRWISRKKSPKVECSGLKPSEIVREIENFSKGNKNIYIAFLDRECSLARDFVFFPHHFRKGLKIFFKQKIVLTINTCEIFYLEMISL